MHGKFGVLAIHFDKWDNHVILQLACINNCFEILYLSWACVYYAGIILGITGYKNDRDNSNYFYAIKQPM